MMHKNKSKGFIAVTAVIVIVSGILMYSAMVMVSAFTYSDAVVRREWRMQANFNAQSCLSTAALMSAKDYFLEGDIEVKEFGCNAHITRDHMRGTVDVRARSIFSEISSSYFEQNFIVP
ncbi:MAG: hypothetical protein V4524_03625 [Patescibacteria group bacterium]